MNAVADFVKSLDNLFRQAELEGKTQLLVNSGDLHRRVGGYPGSGHSMPGCCRAMRNATTVNDKILYEPPKGNGATLEILYSLPRPMRHFVAYHKFDSWGPYDTQQTRYSHYSSRELAFLIKSSGQRIWVIGGKKVQQKTYYSLLSYYNPDAVNSLPEGGFSVEGDGVGFNPPIDLASKPWLPDLLKEQQNFRLGINEIKNLYVIKGLLANALRSAIQSSSQQKDDQFNLPDEVMPTQQSFIEGAVKRITVNAYERDPAARQACITHYGVICQACAFDFEKTYGELGIGYIHVHHTKPLSGIKENYEVNPIEDLVPVCPNCHAMLHKEDPPMSIEKLKNLIAIHQPK